MSYLKIENISQTKNVPIYDLDGKIIGKIDLPKVFLTPVRIDIIRRAFIASLTSSIQPQGRDPMAGKRTTAESRGVGLGIARVPRIKGSMRAALAPMTVGGRRAHPPTTFKKIVERINRKEKILAIKSAIAATSIYNLVVKRGHILYGKKDLPIIVSDKIQSIKKTSELRDILIKLGLWADIERVKEKIRIRAGKGKMRNRRYKKGKSLLIVIYEDDGLKRAARNLCGVDIVNVRNVSIKHLAPGGVPGRLTLWVKSSIEFLREKWG
ncbi:MAG TPA: 50S ribosomal protein L4 [Thermoprotei archaeon]|nr:50S ribosomal protein L4 [Thermoprotei archaeon]